MRGTDDLVGGSLGPYRVVSLLGSGGMGVVYDAVDPSLDRHVAIKVLAPGAVSDPSRLARFEQEARAAAALNHPHIVSIYQIGEEDGVHFIAMEKIEGSTLRQLLAARRLPLGRALALTAQVADAISAAHGAGVVHRDLKPENVMVSPDGYAKVLDFGLAKLQPERSFSFDTAAPTLPRAATQSLTVLGTVGYMSPEQAGGEPVDARSDIFSLGCILYEMVTGVRAFRADGPIETLHKTLHETPRPVGELAPGAPVELQRIVQKALAKSPDERYQTAKDLALDLRALLRELGSGIAPASASGRRPRPGWALPALGAFLIILAAGAAVVWRGTRSAPVPREAAFRRITAKGNLVDVAISPDGRFVVYSRFDTGGESLWLRQIASGEELELVPPRPAGLSGCAFSPDGNSIVYAVSSAAEPRGAFYRVSTIGGPPQRLASGVDSGPTFSPDGKRLAWLRKEFPTPSESALMVANLDGTGERALAVRRYPELFAPIFFTRPSWSPDGRTIAVSVKRLRDPDRADLVGFDPESGRETLLSSSGWISLSALQWLPDGKGIVAIGARTEAEVHAVTGTGNQIWLIPVPSGEPRRITNDLLFYREVSVSADGSRLVADVADATVNIARKALGGTGAPKGISSGHFDGVAGVSTMPDGRLVLSSIENGTTTLWVMNADGSQRRPFLSRPFRDEYPVAFSGGVAYVSFTNAGAELCVTDAGGRERKVVVGGIDDAPIAVSPDGGSFAYSIDRRLWAAFADGRPPRQLTAGLARGPVYAPAGDRIAFLREDAGGDVTRIEVIDAEGKEVWSAASRQAGCRQVRWTREGDALLVSSWTDIWIYPLRGEPRRLERFEQAIWSFDLSSDSVLFVARGTVTRDAVMITDFR